MNGRVDMGTYACIDVLCMHAQSMLSACSMAKSSSPAAIVASFFATAFGFIQACSRGCVLSSSSASTQDLHQVLILERVQLRDGVVAFNVDV